VTVECIEKMACESDGGTSEYTGTQRCVLEAGPGDAATDAPGG
jgi:hypothetical protein